MTEPLDQDAEVIGAIVGLLIDAGIAGGMVFGDEIPDDVVGTMPGPAVEVSPSGGFGYSSNSPLDQQRIDVRSYGASPEEARALSVEVHVLLNRLTRQVIDGVLVHSCIPSGGYLSDREPVTRWPFAWRSYLVLHDRRVRRSGSGSGSGG